jgi:hypothetical protein
LAPAAPLSAIETERLRDMRARLGRRAVSEAALSSLGTAFFQVCAMSDIGGGEPFPVEELSAPALISQARGADMKTLARLVATLEAHRRKQPKAWPAVVAAGAPQALLSRRLALGGREPPVEIPA